MPTLTLVSPSTFKAYDIRGKVGTEINSFVVKRIAQAFVATFSPRLVVVGRDMRETSPELERSLIEGLTSSGVSVVKIGLCSTPMFYFAVGERISDEAMGIMITASHNPAEYNGLKLVQTGCVPIGQGEGMEELSQAARSDQEWPKAASQGFVAEDNGVKARYVKRVQELASEARGFSGRIAVDAGNGMGGFMLPELTAAWNGAEVIPLFWDLDGRFPNHEANPIKEETLNDLIRVVRSESCDLGIALDGDADRVGFVDELGRVIRGDVMTALLAQEMLKNHGPGTILYDVRSSWIVPETVRTAGGTPKMCRVGHAPIKSQMRQEQAVFAGELSMHYFFPQLWFCESTDLVIQTVVGVLTREKKTLSQVVEPFLKYSHSGEINFRVQNPQNVVKKIEEHFATQASEIIHIDGSRLEFRNLEHPENNWWFNLRTSNTEPLLRLNLEAVTAEQMEQRKDELVKLIPFEN